MPMQPRPWADTSSPWLPSFLLSIGPLLVHLDLLFDEVEVPTNLGQPSPDVASVLLEQGEALGLVAVAGAHQVRIAADAPNWHPGRPQALEHLDPSEVLLVVPTVLPGPGAS